MRVLAGCCALSLLLLGGCLGFGGPLVGEGAGEDESSEGEGEGESEGETGEGHPCGPTTALVDHVIDGDTIQLESGERVRYILVDTPEITNGKNECWGEEASLYNEMLVSGREISLEYDAECIDQYGRLLAYVSVDGQEVNRALLELGFACILYIPPNGDARIAEYQMLENEAKAAGVGMWSECPVVPCD